AGQAAGQSLSSNRVSGISVDSKGGVWVSTFDGGLDHIDGHDGSIIVYRHDPKDPGSLDDDTVNAVHVDSADRVWVGTGDGIAQLDPST
ncbi:two-component regulator propeller domain-containing protein, partial [Acinetobacter baumannii]